MRKSLWVEVWPLEVQIDIWSWRIGCVAVDDLCIIEIAVISCNIHLLSSNALLLINRVFGRSYRVVNTPKTGPRQ